MKDIKFSSVPVLCVLLLFGIVLIILKNTVPFFSSSSICANVMSALLITTAQTMISTAALSFIITISTERELIDKIQTRIYRETDFNSIAKEELKKIEDKIVDAKINERLIGINKTEENNVITDVKAYFKQLAADIREDFDDKTYIQEYSEDITLELNDDNIKVFSKFNIVEYNFEDIPLNAFEYSPIFLTEEEINSFSINALKHNDEEIPFNNNPQDYGYRKAEGNPRYLEYNNPPISFDMSKKGTHRIAYDYSYTTKYSLYFHTQTVMHMCKRIDAQVRMVDKRSKKTPKYMIRWEINYPKSILKNPPKDIINNDRDDHVVLKVGDNWFPRGGEYIITLNEK